MSSTEMPEGMRSACTYRGRDRVTLHCDVVVVGLGAGGGMAFHDLARGGHDVLALEMGSHIPTEEMDGLAGHMMPRLYAEGASRATMDMSIQVMQGKGVGGSTLHNTNLCARISEPILRKWVDADPGLADLLGAGLTRDFEAVEELLDVHRIPDDRVNRNNEVFARGRRALGYDGGRLRHNRDGCEQSGFCELGCPNNGKQNAAKVLVPAGLESGGRVLTEARVERVLTERAGWLGGRRVTGVEAAAVDPDSGREVASLRIMARRVVLAASATGSAALAQRSGLPDPHGLTGTNLHLHPGGYVVGIFEGARHEPIEGWIGVPQSEDCTEFLEHGSDATRRAWILPGFAHPEAAAALLPGFGAEHGEMMRLYPRIAVAISMVHDYGTGRVAPGEGEQVHIRYSLSDDDAEQMAMGLREAGRILLAAGADRVFIPMNPPFFASTDRQLRALGPEMLGPANPTLVAVHPMSTMWMGSDPTRSVVDPEGAHHHVDGLYVADGSLFPSSIGSAPQIPIYTFGRRVARAVARGL